MTLNRDLNETMEPDTFVENKPSSKKEIEDAQKYELGLFKAQ